MRICFKCATIVPDSQASSYTHRAPISPLEVKSFLNLFRPSDTKSYREIVNMSELCPKSFKKKEKYFKEPHNKKWGKEANKHKKERKPLIILEAEWRLTSNTKKYQELQNLYK